MICNIFDHDHPYGLSIETKFYCSGLCFSLKEQIIKSATEVASMLLKIDDVIAGGKSKMPPGPPGGGGGGMGGYGGGMDME